MRSNDIDLNDLGGLTRAEAEARLTTEGHNELPTTKPRGFTVIALDVVSDPTFLLLLAAGSIYLLLGDWHEALLLLSFVVMIMGITIYQARKTERALEALRDLSSPRALVIRDGQELRIAGRDVVRGDILVLEEGDRVPADAVLLSCHDLKADESLLTGESVPVRKTAWEGAQTPGAAGGVQTGRPGGDDLPLIYSGTMLVQGQGVAKVLATGVGTEMGRIGKALEAVPDEATPLQREIRRTVRRIAFAALLFTVIVVVLYGVTYGNWLDGLLAGITLAMAILPQEFPVVLTVFLALGAWRIAKQQVLTRHIPAVETLGSTTVLCVDKTGTLTLNRMRVSRLYASGEFSEVVFEGEEALPEQFHEVVEYSILASEIDPFDPMDKAFLELGNHFLVSTEHLHPDWELVREYPLTAGLFAHAHAWRPRAGDSCVVASKGAPEAIAELCRLNAGQRQQLDARVAEMAAGGLRVLAVARAEHHGQAWPESQRAFDFEWVGLVGLADPLRPTVADSLRLCYEAGIRVVMITGDHPLTACAIARQAGLRPTDSVMTGAELEACNDDELRQRIRTVSIFARVVPEQKLRLVNAFKANGEIVAMTGDGVNDAPALKAAHIGIAMGKRGTDVAREAASLVLLDDDFSSIVHAVRLGRRVYENIRNAMCYILAVHVPVAGMALIPLLFGWPVAFFPAHIVFFEFVIDPACSIAFEAEPVEDDVMRRPPRDPGQALFDLRTVGFSLLQGASMLAAVAAVYIWTLQKGIGEDEARAMAFVTIVLGNLGLILANRSQLRPVLAMLGRRNHAMWWVTAGTVAGMGAVLYVPYLRDLFRFAPLHANDLLVCAAAAVLGLLWYEIYKLLRWRGARAGS